ncbi:MAG: hypothetical protein AB7J32_24100 [Pseudonocardia sp.]
MTRSPARILVVSRLANVVEVQLRQLATPDTVTVAADEHKLRAAVTANLRFDVVLTDLTWNDAELEFRFDGFDVLDLLHDLGRAAPVVFAVHGSTAERDHVDEAMDRPVVAGIVRKTRALAEILADLRLVAAGRMLPPGTVRSRVPICRYLADGTRGRTAAAMAGAIAAHRASDHESLAAAAHCSRHTATKLVDRYLGPLIRARGDHPEQLPLTAPVVYRWCGEHALYLTSWCRRNGLRHVLGPEAG